MKQIINSHNRNVIFKGKEKEESTKTCNCRDKFSCPLKGKCPQGVTVYKAIVNQTKSMNQDIKDDRK